MAVLKASQRKKLPVTDFANKPAAKTPAGKAEGGSYPIPDAAHARNALARVAQHGTPAEKARVRAAVHHKFPAIGKSSAKSKKR